MKLRIIEDVFSREYEVLDGDTVLGVVSKWDGVDGANWAANCKETGCWCHGFYRTRREAAQSLLDAGK